MSSMLGVFTRCSIGAVALGGTVTVIDVDMRFEWIDKMLRCQKFIMRPGPRRHFNRRHRSGPIKSTRITRRLVRPPYTPRTGRQIPHTADVQTDADAFYLVPAGRKYFWRSRPCGRCRDGYQRVPPERQTNTPCPTSLCRSTRARPLPVPQHQYTTCLLYTSPSPRDLSTSRMPSSA